MTGSVNDRARGGTMGSAPATTDPDEIARTDHPSHTLSKLSPAPRPRGRAILLVSLVAVISVAGFMLAALRFQNAVPAPQANATIDAIVAGHVTSVSARAAGHVRLVLV